MSVFQFVYYVSAMKIKRTTFRPISFLLIALKNVTRDKILILVERNFLKRDLHILLSLTIVEANSIESLINYL